MINYYVLLDINQTAEKAEIESAIKKARRIWNNRANNPNADIRAEAEQRVRNIAEAEKVLLDDGARATYDRMLSDSPVEKEESSNDNEEDWIDLAIELDERENYDSLANLMEQVTRSQPDNPRAWLWRGVASENQERYSDAEYEIKKAISLEPDNDVLYSVLGGLYAEQDEFQLAIVAFEKALQMDKSNIDYQLDVAECYRLLKKYSEALQLAESAYKQEKTNERVQHIYSLALYSHTMQSLSYNRAFDDYVVTNSAQLSFLKSKMSAFESLPVSNKDVREVVDKVKKILSDAETTQYKRSDRMAAYIVAAVIGLICLFSGSTSAIAGVVILTVTIALYVYRHNMPGWKWQQRQAGQETKSTGLQE